MSLRDRINWLKGGRLGVGQQSHFKSDEEFINSWLRYGRELSAQQQLDGQIAGDTIELVIYPLIPELRSGEQRTITKAWFSVKDKESDSDATENAAWSPTAGARQSITTTDTAGRGVIFNNSEGSPELRFYLTGTNTGLLTARLTYSFDVQILMSDGALYTVERGTFTFAKGITVASS